MYKKIILDYLEDTVPKLKQKFDENHKAEFPAIADYMNESYNILVKVINNPTPGIVTEPEFIVALLLWRGLNTALSAFELIRGGYGVEPLILMRNSLETCCSSLDISIYPNKIDSFKKSTYESTKSISTAKGIFPIIGRFYGILSKLSHPSFSSSYPQYYRDEIGTTHFITGGMYGEENAYYLYMNLCHIKLLFSIYQISIEYIFFRFCDKKKFWKMNKEGKLFFFPPKKEINAHLIRILQMRKSIKSLNNL